MLMTPKRKDNGKTFTVIHTPDHLVAISADDVERRMREVRNSWAPEERVARRRTAAQRFDALVETLLVTL
jgi:hypothetical protein